VQQRFQDAVIQASDAVVMTHNRHVFHMGFEFWRDCINTFYTGNSGALAEADALDAERKNRRVRGPLHGIPVIVKDNYETVTMQTADGSRSLAGWVAGTDAFLVRKLRDAGVIVVAKSNMHEFARGITTLGSLFGQTRNPYALDRNPGGSSGGTGAAIAAN
jgi:amidase